LFDHADAVLVQGDTASAFACALKAFHRNVPVIHLEAGLRSYDDQNPWPEEVYRRMISNIASVHLCPTDEAYHALKDEQQTGEIVVVGNTVLDNLRKMNLDVRDNKQIILTIHRRENRHLICAWIKEFESLAEAYPEHQFTFISHPSIPREHYEWLTDKLEIIDPVPHEEMAKMIAGCTMVITDSGGCVEESSYFNKLSIVCRESTERNEAITTGHSVLCPTPNELEGLFAETLTYVLEGYEPEECPFGDGYASEKIAAYLKSLPIRI
jgi:UDP-N-acetylglucosamine 2-epimerase (non-hydrolysing)